MVSDVFNATVVERHDLGGELSIVRVRPDSGQVADFKPGQFSTLGLPRDDGDGSANKGAPGGRPKLIRRAYSIASSPEQREYLEFYVVRVEGGRLTPKLWTVEQGGRLWMDEKIRGHFTLDDAPAGKDLVMVSTGTGIAPYISMLRTFRGKSRWRRFVMINGVRRVDELGYRQELEETSRSDPTVTYVSVVSREPADSDWLGLRGHVQLALEAETYQKLVGADLDPAQCHVFLCGNPEMIKSVQAMLEGRGFRTHNKKSPGNIHFERYW